MVAEKESTLEDRACKLMDLLLGPGITYDDILRELTEVEQGKSTSMERSLTLVSCSEEKTIDG